jgi:hypothetical protein
VITLEKKGKNYMDLTDIVGPIENSAPAHSQKAVLWGPESVLMDSVEFFLKAGAKWEVVKIPSESGADHLLQRVNHVKPEVVVLCQEKDDSDFNILMRLAQIQFCSKVVVVSLESNLVQVYGRQNLILNQVSDLLSVIDHAYFPNSQLKEEVSTNK